MAADFRRSGLTVAEFAKQKGVTRKMIMYWTGRERELAASRPQELVRMPAPAPTSDAVAAPAPSAPVPVQSNAAIELRFPGGLVATVHPGFDATLLREVIRALAAPC